MNIGIDLDGTIADTYHKLRVYLNIEYCANIQFKDMHSLDFWKVWGGTKEEAIRKVNEFQNSEDFKKICSLPYSKTVVYELKQNHELYIITARPQEIEDYTLEWVNKNFPKAFKKVCFSLSSYVPASYVPAKRKSKYEICLENKISLILEDSPAHAVECAAHKIPVLLLETPWNKSTEIMPYITKIKSIRQAQKFVKQNPKINLSLLSEILK